MHMHTLRQIHRDYYAHRETYTHMCMCTRVYVSIRIYRCTNEHVNLCTNAYTTAHIDTYADTHTCAHTLKHTCTGAKQCHLHLVESSGSKMEEERGTGKAEATHDISVRDLIPILPSLEVGKGQQQQREEVDCGHASEQAPRWCGEQK